MKNIISLILITLLSHQLFSINFPRMNLSSINLPSSVKYAPILTLPLILNKITNLTADKDDHVYPSLLSLSFGNMISSFDRLINLNPDMTNWAFDTLKNSIALYLTDHAQRKFRKSIDIPTKRFAKQNLINFGLNLVFPELTRHTFIPRFTQYLLIFKGLNQILSRVVKPAFPVEPLQINPEILKK